MKFKMSQNSLFAVLLRSPWWVSFVVMAVVAMLAAAVLPKAYVPVGVLGATPFFVIGLVAAWRQRNAPSAAALESMHARISSMPWRDFANAVEKACVAKGYVVTRLQGTAADFRLVKKGTVTLLSAKRWKASNQGVEPLRELVAALPTQDAGAAMWMSLEPVSESAQRLAKAEGVVLLSGTALAQWLLA
jgi:restriction system protein